VMSNSASEEIRCLKTTKNLLDHRKGVHQTLAKDISCIHDRFNRHSGRFDNDPRLFQD